MMGDVRKIGGSPAATALAAVALAMMVLSGCGQSRGEGGTCSGGDSYDDIAVLDGCGPCSTADASQRSRIEALTVGAASSRGLAEVVVDYPADGTLFPPGFHAPTILWHDDTPDVAGWMVQIEFDGGDARVRALLDGAPPVPGRIDERCIAVTNELYEPTPYQASARSWKPSRELWNIIQEQSAGRNATATLFGYAAGDPGRVLSRGSVRIRTSTDPVDGSIFYRDVPLMPSAGEEGVIKPLDQKAQPLIEWRLRDVAQSESAVLLKNLPTCANCHSFTAAGDTLAMDIDGPNGDKGAYGIVDIEPETVVREQDVMTWNAFEGRPQGHTSLGFMSRISPDGRYVLSTVNEALYVRNFWNYRFTQVFFPTRGILAVYDRSSGEIHALPGADDPDFVHCSPAWTPDGKHVVFSRAEAKAPYERGRPLATYAGDPNETQIRYDLYRIPFNDGRGGEAVPVLGASDNGMSNSFPKISPDGEWIVWVQSKNGLLMRPDSKLWIVPLEGGEPRELESNLSLMNSWHSFSPNGRWMVFSSKSNTPYTQMFLTHLDDDGRASPAVLIENSTAANRAVNLPEFVNLSADEFTRITVPAVDHYEHYHRGNELAQAGKLDEAIAEFERALQGEHTDWRVGDWKIHDSLSRILLQIGEKELAVFHVREALRLNPYNAEMHANLGYLLVEDGAVAEAVAHLDAAVRLMPKDAKARYNRGALRLQTGDRTGASRDFDRAIELNPKYTDAYIARGMMRVQDGNVAGALADLDVAVEFNPNNPTARYFRAVARRASGDLDGAMQDVEQGLVVAPPNWANRPELEKLRSEIAAARS